MSKIVINGVDGNFGSLVAQYALELMNKEDFVFTAPKEESLKEYKDQGIQTAIANFNDPEGLVKVFENADKVLLISMPFVGKKRRQAHKNAVDACVKANVKQIIYTSVLSAAHPFNPSIENVDHSYTEAIIQNTSLDYIFLRNSLFVEAFTSDYLRAVDAKETTISKNMGEGRVWFISRKDCAYAAACALNNHLLHRAVLNINGLEPLSYGDFLAIGNKATGNHITYTKLTDDELYAYFDSIGALHYLLSLPAAFKMAGPPLLFRIIYFCLPFYSWRNHTRIYGRIILPLDTP